MTNRNEVPIITKKQSHVGNKQNQVKQQTLKPEVKNKQP